MTTSRPASHLQLRPTGRKDAWSLGKYSRRGNLLQRTMYAWNEVLPYNAVHSIRIKTPFNKDSLLRAIRDSLERCGFSCDPTAVAMAVHPVTDHSKITLQEIFEAELNYRFDASTDALPFRFFVIELPSEEFILGVNYFHPVAGADSICWLLEDIIASFLGRDVHARVLWNGKKPPGYGRLVFRQWQYFLRGLLSMPKFLQKTRRFARMPKGHTAEATIKVHSLTLTTSQQQWIYRKMKDSGATFHDVVLSLVLFSMTELLPNRFDHPRRREIAIGSIVNIRRHFGSTCERVFGLFLATFSVSHSVPEGTTFESLLGEIHETTQRIKRDRLYLRNLLILRADLLWRKFLSPERKASLYLKNFPLAASVTNFFVDRFQIGMLELPVEDYWRSVSASPATPLVISATTFKGTTNLTMNFNDSIYLENEIETFVAKLKNLLESKTI